MTLLRGGSVERASISGGGGAPTGPAGGDLTGTYPDPTINADNFSSDTQVIFNDGGAAAGDSEFVFDKTNNYLGVGTNAPDAQGHFQQTISTALTPGTLSLSLNPGFGSSYLTGQTITYRVYDYDTAVGNQYFSPTYNEYGIVIVNDADGVNMGWVAGTGTGSRILRDIDGGGFVDFYDTASDFTDDGTSFFASGSTVTPTEVNISARLNYTPDAGTTYYSLYGTSKGYIADSLGVGITPQSGSIISTKKAEHASNLPSQIAGYDQNNYEVFGLSGWNGGGGDGGYGALVLGNHVTSGSGRFLEISPRNTVSGDRLGSIIAQTDTGTNTASWEFYTGTGSSFIHNMTMKTSGYNGLTGITAPTANLDIGAGSTARPPLRLRSGAVSTTPLAGAIEFDGTAFYMTVA